MSTENVLNFVSQLFHIYYGLPVIILGVIGGILNIIIFTTLKTFRETTCAFYLTAVSLFDIGQLLTALLVRILSEGFQTDIKNISWVCKVQGYLAEWFALVSQTGICLATIDQVLLVSKYRHLSSLRFAQRCILVTCFLWSIYAIFILIYRDTPFGICILVNSQFEMYMTRFHMPIILGVLPISIMVTFSILAFYNARTLFSRQMNIVRLSRDRQLTAMLLVHVVFLVITILPYTIFYIYSQNQLITDPKKIARNNLITTITILIDYTSFAVSILFGKK
jgi:hypothetical protein